MRPRQEGGADTEAEHSASVLFFSRSILPHARRGYNAPAARMPSPRGDCRARLHRHDGGPLMNIGGFAFAFCALLFVGGSAASQDRMPPIPADKQTGAQKKA